MPRYSLYLQDGEGDRLKGLGGLEASDDQVAYGETVATLGEVLAELLLRGKQVNGTALVIIGEHGQQVGMVRFTDLLHYSIMPPGHA